MPRKPAYSKEFHELVIDFYVNKLFTIADIAKVFRVDPLTVRGILVRNNIAICRDDRRKCPKKKLPNSGCFKKGERHKIQAPKDDAYKKSISETLKMRYRSGAIIHVPGMLGKTTSNETKKKIRDSHSGEKHWNWRGGRSGLKMQIRSMFEYRDWRTAIFNRDNFTCVECYSRGGYLEADHIKQFALILNEYNIKSVDEAAQCSELWDLKNGRTLCLECHRKTFTYLWKSAPQNIK